MNSISYNFYNVYGVRIDGLKPYVVPDIHKFLAFRAPRIELPDLLVEIGPFQPDLTNTVSVDHRYAIRRDYIYWKDKVKGRCFQAEIQGVDSDKTLIRFHADWRNRLNYPWMLFPDWTLNLYLLQPFLEYKLAERGIYFLHSGGVVKDGKGILIAGRGGSFKTSFVMELLRQGYSLLGDDLVALSGGLLLPHPIWINFLAFLTRNCESESLHIPGQFRLFVDLWFHQEPAPLDIATQAIPGTINLIYRCVQNKPQTRSMRAIEEIVSSLRSNNELERLTSVSYRYVIGQFLDAYGYVFPEHFLHTYWANWGHQVQQLVAASKSQRLDIPLKWHADNVSYLLV
jgi:hypothetical protein|tara:strand:- start:507 stop:1532 length:1026 start_codon:yes stop_codon:yes gene_type:complete